MSGWTLIGRQDLIRIRREVPGIPPELAAELCGYVREESEPTKAMEDAGHAKRGRKAPPRTKPKAPPARKASLGFTLVRMVESWPIDPDTWENPDRDRDKPIDLDDLRPLPNDAFDAVQVPPPPHPDLIPWSRLWPYLRRALGWRREGAGVDTRRLLAEVTALKAVTRLPRLRYPAWPASLRVIIDWRDDLSLFWDDMQIVFKRLKAVHERERVRLIWKPEDRALPVREEAVLALTDLGLYRGDPGTSRDWCDHGLGLRRSEIRHVALVPVPRDRWEAGLAQAWSLACWDRGPSLPRHGVGQSSRVPHPADVAEAEARRVALKERLLTLISPLTWVEPGFLRAIRLLPGMRGADVGTEYDAWNDSRLCEGTTARAVLPEDAVPLIGRLAASQDPDLGVARKRLVELWRHWNRGVAEVIRAVETEYLARSGAPIAAEELEAAREIRRRALATYYRAAREDRAAMAASLGFWVWQERELARADLEGADHHDPTLSGAFALRRHWTDADAVSHPAALDGRRIAEVSRRLMILPKTDTHWEIQWQGAQVILRDRDARGRPADRPGLLTGSPVGWIRARTPLFEVLAEYPSEPAETQTLARDGGSELRGEVAAARGLTLTSDREVVKVQRSPKPQWATRMGQDRFGGYAEFEVDRIPFRLRWIPPGTFLMGSPEDENGRSNDEGPQHRVTLSRGYWLAETPCTQAQWEVVMEANPSESKGSSKPVESVDWFQAREYCQSLSALVPGLIFRLPTEAQWEYACRAGTNTAFNDGSPCTKPTGKDPGLDRLGWYIGNSRSETHPVREKEPNAWGLYDMHGNVWEWCDDTRREYRPKAALNPVGLDVNGARRILRGGGSGSFAWGCRSAPRYVGDPGYRYRDFGFRLAAGSAVGASGADRSVAGGAGAPAPEATAEQGRATRARQESEETR